MKVGIMQPYLLPYLGYWQLMNCVDCFVIYDNLQYEKAGWMRRNRFLLNGKSKLFSIPVKKDFDDLNIIDRYLADNSANEINKILNQISISYKKAPYFDNVYPLIKKILQYEDKNLFRYIYNSIMEIKSFLNISTPILISSQIDINHNLKGKDKVMEICHFLEADIYINPIGGTDLYDIQEFKTNGITLFFLKSDLPEYTQMGNTFLPSLSIIDILMFNSKEQTKEMLNKYHLL